MGRMGGHETGKTGGDGNVFVNMLLAVKRFQQLTLQKNAPILAPVQQYSRKIKVNCTR
jgi:hypothetical protein